MTPFSRIERGRTLAQLLMLAFSLLSVLVLVVAASLQLAAHFRTERRALYANQQQIAERARNAVGGFIQEKCRVLAATASLTDPDTTSVAQWDLVLQRLLGLERTFRRVAVSEPDGGAVASAARYSPTRPGESSRDSRILRFSRRADADSGAFISDVYIDPITSEPLASIRVPVFNALRVHRKTLTAELNLKLMWDLVDRLEVGRSGYAYVVDEQGTLLAFGDTARVLRGESVATIPTVAEFVSGPAQRTTRGVQIYRGLEGSFVVGTYVPLGTPSWAIVTELPWTEAFRDVIAAALITLLIIAAMAVIASLSGRVVSRRLAVPLVSLKETATRIAGGERSLAASVEGPEEVVELAAAFNSMSSQLQQSIEELQAQVSEVAAARDALEVSAERLRLAQEGTSDAIWDWELAEDRLHLSPRLCSMLGYGPDEVAASWQGWLSLLHPDDKAAAERELRDASVSGHAFAIECRMSTKSGGWLWILTRGKAVAWNDEGRPLRLAGSHSDISKRKLAEEQTAALEERLLQAQKMEAVALLAGGIAHDFNNMLSVILGRAELAVRKTGPEDPFRADFGEIIAVARRSADLTRQLLAFSRQQTIAPKVLDLDDTITGVLKLLRPIAGENVDLAWKPGLGTWPVRMDPAQIDQMLANLLVNARDAIVDVGKVVIETGNASFDASYCAAHPGSAPGDYVMLAVSDSGSGMDKETQARIFDPFFTTKQLGKGTGLGLATVHGIVKQNRGFINVYSEPGSGTTFRIYLPRHRSQPDAAAAPAHEELVPTGQETILLVEDEQALLQIAIAMLRQLGYVVLAADGPAAALARAREHPGPIHLVITDVIMPEMNGKGLMTRLAAIHPGARCLFISGYTADVISHQGLLEEGLHFLQKPFSLRELAVKVRAALAAPVARTS
jgi:PAS domain S-box-containing protein